MYTDTHKFPNLGIWNRKNIVQDQNQAALVDSNVHDIHLDVSRPDSSLKASPLILNSAEDMYCDVVITSNEIIIAQSNTIIDAYIFASNG